MTSKQTNYSLQRPAAADRGMQLTFYFYCWLGLLAAACTLSVDPEKNTAGTDTAIVTPVTPSTERPVTGSTSATDPFPEIKTTNPEELVQFARQFLGVPYLYASTDPQKGFDCSGFINHVFHHFNIAVPRSSVEFTNLGREIKRENARTGDLILFTGTNDSIRIVGHMGIVTENTDSLRFIHSSSGKARGVTITALNKYYQQRFMKVIRLFPD